MSSDRAPADIERRLRALRCDCGAPADTVHIVDPKYALHPPWRTSDDDRDTYARGSASVARACCPAHTLDGKWISVDILVTDWRRLIDDMSEQRSRGDDALHRLLS